MNGIAGVVVALAVIVAVVLLHDIFFLAFAGVLLAVAFRGLANPLRRNLRLPDALALTLAVLALVVVVAGVIWYAAVVVVGQYEGLKQAIPAAFAESLARIRATPLGAIIPADLQTLIPNVMGLVQRATGLLSSVVAFLIGLAIIVFVGVCLAVEPAFYRDGAVTIAPIRMRSHLRAVLDEIGSTLQGWLLARLISMVAIAVLVTVGLHFLRIPFAAALGALAGVLAFIPNIGAFVAALPAVIFALAQGPMYAAIVIAMYWVAHTLDDFLVIPIAERRIVKLPPALTILVQLALGTTVGLLGVALAAPLTVVGILAVRRLWVDGIASGVQGHSSLTVKADNGTVPGTDVRLT